MSDRAEYWRQYCRTIKGRRNGKRKSGFAIENLENILGEIAAMELSDLSIYTARLLSENGNKNFVEQGKQKLKEQSKPKKAQRGRPKN